MSRGNNLSPADLAALDVLAACQRDTQKAVQELAHSIAVERGAPQPDPPKSKRSYRLTITRDAAGEMTAAGLEHDDGSVRRLRVSRDANGDLVCVSSTTRLTPRLRRLSRQSPHQRQPQPTASRACSGTCDVDARCQP